MYDFLKGIRVIEMGHIALGPLAAQMLGDYGADVIKIEAPGGDIYRNNGVSREVGMSAQWMACNRNKRSLALDLKSEEGRAVLREMLAASDAFLHNMRPPAIKRLGFDYEAVRQINPKIVYCFSGGFGQDGPYRDYPAFDDIIQAYCGLTAINGVQTGRPEFVPMVVCDTITGLNLGQALLAGLLRQKLQGEGICIEVPMYEVMVNAIMNQHLSGQAFRPAEGELGYRRVLDPSRRPCATKDGFLVHGVYKHAHWRKFLAAVGRQDILDSGMVDDPQTVAANIAKLYQITMTEIMPRRSNGEWIALFDELDIPYGRVQRLEDLQDDVHLQAVNLFEDFEHPSQGTMRQVRQPVTVTGAPRQKDIPAPDLGKDSRAVLRDFGFDEARISELQDGGHVVGA